MLVNKALYNNMYEEKSWLSKIYYVHNIYIYTEVIPDFQLQIEAQWMDPNR